MLGYASYLLQSAVTSDDKQVTSETCRLLKEVLLEVVGSKDPHLHWRGVTAKRSAVFAGSQPPARWAQGVQSSGDEDGDAGGVPSYSLFQGPVKGRVKIRQVERTLEKEQI